MVLLVCPLSAQSTLNYGFQITLDYNSHHSSQLVGLNYVYVFCNCSSIGSTSLGECNATGHCHCQPGYTGPSIPLILPLGNLGPSPSGCHWHGEDSICHPSSFTPDLMNCNHAAFEGASTMSPSLENASAKLEPQGIKCAQCQEGFSKFNGTSCAPCRCNNHSLQCDPLTGACLHCHGNTEGPYCENCKGQFYRNHSEQHECLRCPCSTEFSSGSCQIKPGQQTPSCVECRPGYIGTLCNECNKGYYSSDSICLKCQCNGNVDPALSPRVCKADTGECIDCLYHTAGVHCETCQEGYAKHSEGGNCTKEANGTDGLPKPIFRERHFNIIILTVIIILVVLLMGFVGAVYTYREYQNRKLNAPFWTIELKEDNISFSSYHDSIPNADISGLLEDDANEVAPNGQLTLATPMHNYKA
ncbi:putative Multiple epidermal growth factor-like domains protein [Naja naja]|nr:putative Multiple epidermal growth factor-like domains protein [Naja naja]